MKRTAAASDGVQKAFRGNISVGEPKSRQSKRIVQNQPDSTGSVFIYIRKVTQETLFVSLCVSLSAILRTPASLFCIFFFFFLLVMQCTHENGSSATSNQHGPPQNSSTDIFICVCICVCFPLRRERSTCVFPLNNASFHPIRRGPGRAAPAQMNANRRSGPRRNEITLWQVCKARQYCVQRENVRISLLQTIIQRGSLKSLMLNLSNLHYGCGLTLIDKRVVFVYFRVHGL